MTALTTASTVAYELLPSAAAAAPVSTDVHHAGRAFRVNGKGQIQVSENGGRTWSVHANFGPTRPVRRLTPTGTTIRADVAERGNPFSLELTASGSAWKSV